MAIRCPGCGFDNDASHRFCAGCGNRLGKTCPACGRGCDPAHRFCPDCGTSLDAGTAPASPSVPETPAPTERRLVTTLFCDLVGFTSLSEQLDPERVRGLLTAYFDRCRNVIEGFGGEVDKYTGDAITAFWGARRALPDDAERAVRAGLELIEEVPALGDEVGIEGLQLRVGVNTGETAVGPGGNEKGLVLGDVVNVAARLQSVAEPGTVVVGDTTRRLTEDAIAYQELGLLALRGKEESVRGWRALRVETARGGRGRTDGIEPPFVGRQYELRLVEGAPGGDRRREAGPAGVDRRRRRQSASRDSPGSSRSTSTASWRASTGTRAALPPTPTASPSAP
jgi:Adenylate cyclase, family 3 (some proteins contain HAMP domain)